MRRVDALERAEAGLDREPKYTVVPGSWNDFECLEHFPAEEDPAGSSSWIAKLEFSEVAAAIGGVAALAATLAPLL